MERIVGYRDRIEWRNCPLRTDRYLDKENMSAEKSWGRVNPCIWRSCLPLAQQPFFWPTSSLSYKPRWGRLWRHHLSSSPFPPSQWSFIVQVCPIQPPFYSGIKYCLLNQQIAKKLPPACDRIVFNSFRFFQPVKIQTTSSIYYPEDH